VSVSVIDLFSGCGGLSYGAHAAASKLGINMSTKAAVDLWPAACETYAANLGVDPIVKPITKELLVELSEQYPSLDLLLGGPPCQGFSSIGRRALDDPRNQLVRVFVEAVDILRPKAFLMENVNGFVTLQGGSIFKEVVESFRSFGYGVHPAMVLASAYGVPQHRRRCFIVGIRNDGNFNFPLGAATYVVPKNKNLVLDIHPDHLDYEKVYTFNEATSDLPGVAAGRSARKYKTPPQNAYQKLMRRGSRALTEHRGSEHHSNLMDLLPYIPEGKSALDSDVYKKIPKSLRPTSGFGNSYARIVGDEPSPTITRNFSTPSSANCIHPTANRALTVREAARCQSFPDRFVFLGTPTEKRLQVGNAVPPQLAQKVVEALLKQLNTQGDLK
jgi:DNA (cytosine-5)-methyltransferase 1